MKFVAVVGSRGYNNYDEFMDKINHYTKNIKEEITFVSGGAYSGADALIDKFCKEHGLGLIVYPADWDKHGKRAGYIRNVKIVAKANFVLAFWDGISKGTLITIKEAKKNGRPLRIVKV